MAPTEAVLSLRHGTKAQALRAARTCYDHLAGRLGVALMGALLERGVLKGGDGAFHPEQASRDRLSDPGRDVDYRITPPRHRGASLFRRGHRLASGRPPADPVLR